MLVGCGSGSKNTADSSKEATTEAKAELKDGTYVATFNTNSNMFHVNDAHQDKGLLTVKNGKMTIHVSLVSQNIVNVFYGNKEDAQKDGAKLIKPTTDSITYEDGYQEDVYGFDIPVPYLNKNYTVSIIGTKGKWYQHKVSVTDPQPGDSVEEALKTAPEATTASK